MRWEINDLLTATSKLPFKFTSKLACFDLDGTLIKTKSGKRFPQDENDWIFFSENVESKLNELHKNGYCIIIITNQSGLSDGTKREQWKKKLDQISTKIALPIKLFCSISHDLYRKPLPTIMEKLISPAVPNIDFTKSFFCGDACGRQGDHSDCDYKFALNTDLKFRLPEELFNGEAAVIPDISYEAFDEIGKIRANPVFVPREKEMILMVGYPGSGKSKYTNDVLVPLDYTRINRDTLKTQAKCLKFTKKVLEEGKNVVIDNTNYDEKNRAAYIKLAEAYEYSVRCIIIDASYEVALHNSMYRFYKGNGAIIPQIVYRLYKKNYKEPLLTEKIEQIIKITPEYKQNDPDYKLYLF
ncbi:MAG: polynucleotide phosphatase/kinase [Harvfovirus sp.]|uniref:Polynucleotide phosphatase/kinase n=1 Tax=Harvfovirus sp. TaxID=2487768 RepID=A0A3G5A649_9VIRU|nr:MAG: polynucleotide phosphatase/kinase [Harvfovirus sp.]